MPTLRELAEANLTTLCPDPARRRLDDAAIKLFRRMWRLGIEIQIDPQDAVDMLACQPLPGPVATVETLDAQAHRRFRERIREEAKEKAKKRKKAP